MRTTSNDWGVFMQRNRLMSIFMALWRVLRPKSSLVALIDVLIYLFRTHFDRGLKVRPFFLLATRDTSKLDDVSHGMYHTHYLRLHLARASISRVRLRSTLQASPESCIHPLANCVANADSELEFKGNGSSWQYSHHTLLGGCASGPLKWAWNRAILLNNSKFSLNVPLPNDVFESRPKLSECVSREAPFPGPEYQIWVLPGEALFKGVITGFGKVLRKRILNHRPSQDGRTSAKRLRNECAWTEWWVFGNARWTDYG